ncbi:hypothetical protein E1B28_001184 [Marasmius oreades]|uniref:DUF6697 domain-containing protein n=1 Tax=Marasmius oreades TaxID=181124 RepID=A0A9P8AEX1_9AGAR|nr:uncharacterized protein E1B28_001184 [Marasmius oreades]KAG7099326.1 hypothetical protein E1B28_001184 [Marasmius oreades]
MDASCHLDELSFSIPLSTVEIMNSLSIQDDPWSSVYHERLLSIGPTDGSQHHTNTYNGPQSTAKIHNQTQIPVPTVISSQLGISEAITISQQSSNPHDGRETQTSLVGQDAIKEAVAQQLEKLKNEWRESLSLEINSIIGEKCTELHEEIKRLNSHLQKQRGQIDDLKSKLAARKETLGSKKCSDCKEMNLRSCDKDILELSSDSETELDAQAQSSTRRREPLVSNRLPQQRASVLPSPVCGIDTGKRRFTRDELRNKIGGSIQTTLVRVTDSKRPIAKELNMDGYLCPNIHQNPWCPNTPGEHGYIFVGLGGDRETFLDVQQQHVFVGEKDKGKLAMTYVGLYRCKRAENLTVEEWHTLSPEVQDAYSKLTKDKNKDGRSLERIRTDYDQGILRVPCVELVCLEYVHRLFEALASNERCLASSTTFNSRSKRPRHSTSRNDSSYDDDVVTSESDLFDFSSAPRASRTKLKRPRLDYGVLPR